MASKAKVLLVYPNLQMINLMPSNIAILSAYLKRAGAEVRLFDTTLYPTSEKSVDDIRVEHMQLRPFNLKAKGVEYKSTDVFSDFEALIDEYRPQVIGVSLTDDTYELGMRLLSRVKEKISNTHVVAGGVYTTFSPDEVIKHELIDSICIGEGEEALVELVEGLSTGADITKINNLWVKTNGSIYKNRLRKPVDVKQLPFEDFDIFEEKRFFRPMQGKVYKMMPICIDRGCPFICAFCAAPLVNKLYSDYKAGNYCRQKPISKIISEIKEYISKYNFDYIYFNSETFFAKNQAYIKEFAQSYSKDVGLPFWCQTRIETITEDRIKLLEEMSCDRISIGLEHGNEEFRKKVLKKPFTNQQVESAFKILARSRIPVTVNNMIGFPDETRELVFDTIRLNRLLKVDSINAYFFVPYRGTPLRQYCIDKGYIQPDTKTSTLMIKSVLNMPQFSQEQIKGMVRTFPLYVKLPESYFDRIKIAEDLSPEGNKMFLALRDIYFKEYFK